MPMPPAARARTLVLTALFVALAAFNAALFLARDKRDAYVPATYQELYVPSDAPRLTALAIPARARVELRIDMPGAPPAAWSVSDDTGAVYESPGRYPVLTLREKKHAYEVRPAGAASAAPFRIQFGYYPSEYYKAGGRTQKDNNWLVSADIPVGAFARRPLRFWAGDDSDLDPADLAEGARLVREEAGVAPEDPSAVKIEKLAVWLIGRWTGHSGTPDDAIEAERSPLRVFQRVVAGKGKIWCSQHAKIYTFFANRAGLPTRLVSLAGRVDDVITTGHAFAETWLPETRSWAKVDTSLNKILVLNAAGRPLDAADVYHAILSGHLDGLTARAVRDGAIVSEPYAAGADADAYYYSPGSSLVYHTARSRANGALARYLFRPDYSYAIDGSLARRVFALRRVMFFAAVLAGLLALVSLAAGLMRRRTA